MSQSIWKLAALSVVVGIGALVFIQAQSRLNHVAQQEEEDRKDDAAPQGSDSDSEDVEIVKSQAEPPLSLDLFDEEADKKSKALGSGRTSVVPRREARPPRKPLADPFVVPEELEPDDDLDRLSERPSETRRAPDNRGAKTSRKPALEIRPLADEDSTDSNATELAIDETVSDTRPRLLTTSDDSAEEARPKGNAVKDPFVDDEMPTVERAPPRRTSAAPLLPLADLEDEIEEPKFESRPKPLRDPKDDDEGPAAVDAPSEPTRLTPAAPPPERLPIDRAADKSAAADKSTVADDDMDPRTAPAPDESRPPARRSIRPKVTIEKEAPPEAVLGQPMIYRILVRNVGTVPARQVVVEDSLPDAVKIDGSIPQALLDKKRLVWKLGTLEPGDERKISVRVIPQSEGTVGSVATVNFTGESATAGPPAPKLKFELKAPAQVVAGSPVVFGFRVTNIGSVDALDVKLRNVLPSGLRHPDADDLEFPIGTLAAGKTCEVDLTVTAAQLGRIVNRALVTAQGNVSEEAEASIDVIGPALHVTRTGPKQLFPGKPGHFANLVLNPGPTPATNVQVVETLPPGMEFVSASDAGQFNSTKRTITWTIGRLAAQEAKTVQVTLNAASRGAQVSVVRAYDDSGASGESVRTTHVAGVAALRIEIGELAANVEVGEDITVPIRVLNRGSDSATSVRASVTLPQGLEFVAAKGPVDYRLGTENAPIEKGSATRGAAASAPPAQVLRFAPIPQLDSRGDIVIELTLKARRIGNARMRVEVHCDQIAEPVSREEATTVTATAE